MPCPLLVRRLVALSVAVAFTGVMAAQVDDKTVRVFLFAGQSNMVGADSHVADIERFPPFAGLGEPQPKVRFWYCIGRENKQRSDGWVALQPVGDMVGPELSFAREVGRHIAAPLAIIKCAAGGTHLGGDWNPDEPSGFAMYPLMRKEIAAALGELNRRKIRYRIEGFVWHQGENDMFVADYMQNYGANLGHYLACWRRDLQQPELRFYIGELCTKTIWGMDLRPRMYAISRGQRAVTDVDPLAQYVPTSHVGVEIGGGVGLHYHYGTLGQLEHGVNYAHAYLRNIGALPERSRPLPRWPYAKGSRVRLFVLAGHRNMEGERAFVQQLGGKDKALRKDDPTIAYRYNLGGGYRVSDGYEPLGPVGCYDTFGPELSFARRLRRGSKDDIAIAKFTHSGSQIIDWTPAGSEAKSRNLFEAFVTFVRESIAELEAAGQAVELAGICYHLGENDMSWMPFRKGAAERLQALITGSREALGMPELRWFVSQQEPTDDDAVNGFDVEGAIEAVAAADARLTLIRAFGLPGREQQLVLTTAGVVALGDLLAEPVLAADR
ncbi:MAG: hypothetical protein KDC98_10400 [Planctomycetes bacterium]|nr:hypothetical protein [Planctomycetota bacterium]